MPVSKQLLVVLLVATCVSVHGYSFFGSGNNDEAGSMIYHSGNSGDVHSVQHEGETMYLSHTEGSQSDQQQFSQSGSSSGSSGGWFRSRFSSGSQQEFRSNAVKSQDLEDSHVHLQYMGGTEERFLFTLNPPLTHSISREEAGNYMEPGWTIEDSRNREVDVYIDIPLGMRRQRPGDYEITYRAVLRGAAADSPALGVQKRQCRVVDKNECLDGTHDCSQFATCIHLSSGGYKCECNSGYRGTGKTCRDIDECSEGTAVCDIHASCINTSGSYICECNAGFKKRETSNGHYVCEDVDECATGLHQCSVNANCQNLPGSYQCKCKDGFEGDGRTCNPINKCTSGDITCHPYATCVVHNNGEYGCKCRAGFVGDGKLSCEDINECLEGTFSCPEHSICRNTFGAYDCICKEGFQKRNGVCVDIDECATGIHNCPNHSHCYNSIGSYRCECYDGYIKSEDGSCEDVSGVPKLTLKGPNPMTISLFETYSEPGFFLEDEKEEMSLIVRIPPRLHGIARYCGTYEIAYEATDLMTQKKTLKTRTVHVSEVDQCKLPDSSPFADNCHDYARCIYLTGQCDYVCQCPPGYDGNGFAPDGCRDAVPPVLMYNGPEPYIKELCVVCGSAIAQMPNLEEPIITKAYDATPTGQKDVSDRIQLTTEPSPHEDCIIHNYSVVDDFNNVATKRLTVCLKVEDMRTIIMEMKAMYSWQMWLIRNVAFFCVLAFILFCVWEFGHRIASCFKVLLGDKPSHDDKDAAYSLMYRIANPLASKTDIRAKVAKKVFCEEDDDDVEEYDYDSEEYESED